MTARTSAVLAALVAAGPLTAPEIAARLGLANGNAVVASLVSICDQGWAIRVAGTLRRYEVTERGRAVMT